jgi:hypothetical protein
MLIFDGLRKYDNLVCAAWVDSKPFLGCDNARQSSERSAESPDFDSQPYPIAFIGTPGTEGSRDESFPRHICGPLFCECSRQGE